MEGGKIVDGIGGATGGMGFLTSGGMDVELVQLGGRWEKSDVFTGGAALVSGRASPREMIENVSTDKGCRKAWEAMVESVEEGVASMMVSVRSPREILLSRRLTRIKKAENELVQRLERFAQVRRIGWLEGVKKVKESAQGYAMVADGLAGGKFSDLVGWVEIKNAKGTVLDYLYHPKGGRAKEELGGKSLSSREFTCPCDNVWSRLGK